MNDEKRADRKEYLAEWYRQHADELSEKRKDKYRTDPEYRKKVKEQSRRYREKKKAEIEELKRQGLYVKPEKKLKQKKVDVVNVNGVEMKAYPLSVLAKRVGRTINTINKWITIGTIPRTPFWSSGGVRLYTDAMILVVKVAIQSRGLVGNDPAVREEILEGWKDLGIDLNGRKLKARHS